MRYSSACVWESREESALFLSSIRPDALLVRWSCGKVGSTDGTVKLVLLRSSSENGRIESSLDLSEEIDDDDGWR
jgi:hypothetical protein